MLYPAMHVLLHILSFLDGIFLIHLGSSFLPKKTLLFVSRYISVLLNVIIFECQIGRLGGHHLEAGIRASQNK